MTDLAALLDDVQTFVGRYVVMTSDQAAAVALWIAHSYVVDGAELSPYLAISSAEKRSGKTTTMKVLELLVARPAGHYAERGCGLPQDRPRPPDGALG